MSCETHYECRGCQLVVVPEPPAGWVEWMCGGEVQLFCPECQENGTMVDCETEANEEMELWWGRARSRM